MKRVLVVACLAALACGCESSGLVSRLAALKSFAAEDAKIALEIATNGGDRPAMQCLPFIVSKLETLAEIEATATAAPQRFPGLLEQFETLRVAIHGSGSGEDFLADLDLHCAALRTSIEIDVAKGAMLVSGVIGSGGASAPSAAKKVIPILRRLLTR